MKKNKFTLIELIVVIAVIGILAAIVIPNISNMQGKANQTALNSNIRNLQTAADMYSIEHNGGTIGVGNPDSIIPQSIDFAKINPDYIRNVSKVPNAKYWVDVNGQVWGSTADAPLEVKNVDGTVTWKSVPSATGYQVFEVTENTKTGWTANYLYKKVGKPLSKDATSYTGAESKKYAVSAIDEKEFLTAPVGLGGVGGYIGYEDTLTSGKDGHSGSTQPDAPGTTVPAPTIVMTPADNLKANTTIDWSYDNKDAAKAAEWKVDGVSVTTPPSTLNEGNHTIELRVQDQNGNWSNWSSKTVPVASSLEFSTNYAARNFVSYDHTTTEFVQDSNGNVVTVGGDILNTTPYLAKNDASFDLLKKVSLDFTPKQITLTTDGNYVIVGYKASAEGNNVGVVSKYDSSLNLVKSTTFGEGKASMGYEELNDVTVDAEGNIYAVGLTTSYNLHTLYPNTGATPYTSSYHRLVAVKLDKNLNVIRINNNLSTSSLGSLGLTLNDVVVDSTGNVYVAGTGTEVGMSGSSSIIAQLDSNLNTIKKVFGTQSDYKEMIFDKLTGNVLVIGNDRVSKKISVDEYDKSLALIKQHLLSYTSIANAIAQDNNGMLLIGNQSGSIEKVTKSGTSWTSNGFVNTAYYGPQGNVLNGKINAIVPSSDGGILYTIGSSLGKTGGNPVKSNFYILNKVDTYVTGANITVKGTIPEGARIQFNVYSQYNSNTRDYNSWLPLTHDSQTATYKLGSGDYGWYLTPYFSLIPNEKGEYPTLDSVTFSKK